VSSSSQQDQVEHAPAKINLHLHVVGRRTDGYHLLDSLVVFAGIGDQLTVSPAEDLSLSVTGPFAAGLEAEADNLVLRAARALATKAGVKATGALVLQKNLPVASGIGGGSADAAAALRLLCRFWGLERSLPRGSRQSSRPIVSPLLVPPPSSWPGVSGPPIAAGAVSGGPDTPGHDGTGSAMNDPALLTELGAGLGADVPVCVAGVPALMSGIGEILNPAPKLPNVGIVLINPGVAVSTPAVFRARSAGFSTPARFPAEGWRDADALAATLRDTSNDLQPPALSLAPVIGEVLDALVATPGCLLARMSGSGATCFGLFPDPAAAQAAARTIVRDGWWVWGGGLQAG